VSWLRRALPRVAAPLADLSLVTDGKRIFYLSPNPGKLVDVLAGGQLVLTVPLGDALREVGKELPKARAQEPAYYDLPEVVEPGESGYYVGYCPVLRGCVAQGRTREEAHANLKKRQVKAPKVYLRDTGLLHHLLGIHSEKELLMHPNVELRGKGMSSRRHFTHYVLTKPITGQLTMVRKSTW
jgi:hypothetical protein